MKHMSASSSEVVYPQITFPILLNLTMHIASLAMAAFAVVAYALPVEDTIKAVVLPPVHRNPAREAVLEERATTSIPLPKAGDDPLYIKYALDHHNKHRSNHIFNGKPTTPMKWNATTARTAKTVADLCIWAHKMPVPSINNHQLAPYTNIRPGT